MQFSLRSTLVVRKRCRRAIVALKGPRTGIKFFPHHLANEYFEDACRDIHLGGDVGDVQMPLLSFFPFAEILREGEEA